jgi:hypothetical protein
MTTIGLREARLFQEDFNLLGDFFDFFCGELLGEGAFRTVYTYGLNRDWVVKIARVKDTGLGRFDNIAEWDIYQNLKVHHPELLKYLAKPLHISSCGRVMIMERTTPLTDKDKLPKKIPAFLTDIKEDNWGRIGRRIVCHDYGNHNLYKHMNTKLILRR